MGAVLGGSLAPLGASLGFVEAPAEVVLEQLRAWRRDLGESLTAGEVAADWPGCLRALVPLESPWTTELVAAHDEDGRWSWHADGPVQPFERPQAYKARRIRDRFARDMLVAYLGALGIDADSRYGPAVMQRQRVSWPTRKIWL